jgi:hypothetical protein
MFAEPERSFSNQRVPIGPIIAAAGQQSHALAFKPLVQLKPKAPMGCKLVGTAIRACFNVVTTMP